MPSETSWKVKVWLGDSYVTTYLYATGREAWKSATGFAKVGCRCEVVEPAELSAT
jgi:hypothetical protein